MARNPRSNIIKQGRTKFDPIKAWR